MKSKTIDQQVSIILAEQSPDDIWYLRTQKSLLAILPIFVSKTKLDSLPPSSERLVEFLKLNNLFEIVTDDALPEAERKDLSSYLTTLPKVNEEVLKQGTSKLNEKDFIRAEELHLKTHLATFDFLANQAN